MTKSGRSNVFTERGVCWGKANVDFVSQEPRRGLDLLTLALGGIGLMNVMLMTVTERSREIGIRRATGAHTRDILRQFLTEAMMVSGAGGTISVVIGIVIGALAAAVFRTLVIFSRLTIAAAVLCAVLGGFAFGFPMAWRDARLKRVAASAME